MDITHIESPAKLMAALRAKVRTTARELTTPTWHPALGWVDAGGLHCSDKSAWLYLELPRTILRPGARDLDDLLTELAGAVGRRAVHLSMYTWETKAQPPGAGSVALRDYQDQALAFSVPTRRLTLGVELVADGDATRAESSLRSSTFETIDRMLGEYVPNMAKYDQDRAGVAAVLGAYGAIAIESTLQAHMLTWFTSGLDVAVVVDEEDLSIRVGDGALVELCSVAAVRAGVDTAPVTSAGHRGAVVLSVRATLKAASARGSAAPAGAALQQASVVYGRRAHQPRGTLGVALRAQSGATLRPLPMRQLVALDETLPCSTKRCAATLVNVHLGELRALGMSDDLPYGDDAGLLVGLVGANYTVPTYLDLMANERNVNVVAGDVGSGTSVTARHLAVQAAAAGARVLVVSPDPGWAVALSLAGPVVVLCADDMSAHRWLRPDAAHQFLAETIPDLCQLSETERATLLSGFARAGAEGGCGLARALVLCGDPVVVAKVNRAVAGSAAGQALVAAAAYTAPPPLAVLAGDSSAVFAALLAAAAGQEETGVMLVVDDGAPVMASAWAWWHVCNSAASTVLVTHDLALAASRAGDPHVGARIVHAVETERAGPAGELVGVPLSAAAADWLAGGWPDISEDDTRPPYGLLRDSGGRVTPVLLGPLGSLCLPALRGDAAEPE